MQIIILFAAVIFKIKGVTYTAGKQQHYYTEKLLALLFLSGI